MEKILHLIYFSPTGTSRSIGRAVSSGFEGYEIREYDLTRPDSYLDMRILDGLAVFAFPVYGGRMQKDALERMQELTGHEVPAVLAVVYGNRAFEDALVELRDVVSQRGFVPFAGAAFIGEHSYADAEHPIALGRPDEADLADAKKFGKQAFMKVFMDDTSVPEMAGNVPYKDTMLAKGATPKTNESCIACGACVKVCPTKAIKISDGKSVSNGDKCIMCMACAKKCAKDSRYIDVPVLLERIEMLVNNCAERKSPSIFI
jgi:ferredoxin